MADTAKISDLLEALDRLSPRIPVQIDLWSVREIAAYLKRSDAVVRDRIVAIPDFPPAIRLPTASGIGRGQPLWKARDVIAWAENYQERD
ncbi:hypothetical protein [Acidihalobacter ferrooxydans]|uniref:DNA-binding protein n=1 Tax=Acidihalobacter ferrooxydans TaxID=1765967 RepID=A0A1P8UFN1_9GAMM|nr:hypothetical protein [Acidihalobacter ferrooxydans]APZ42647.1 hypothetical protein BW247_05660 [Acidihalobacter ferrooxydans]